jgi:hypothetical protein
VRADFLTLTEEPTIATGDPTPPITDPEPAEPTPPTTDYELKMDIDNTDQQQYLYLIDYANSVKYKISTLLDTIDQYDKLSDSNKTNLGTIAGQKLAIILLVILCCILIAALVYLFFRLHETKDDAIYRPSPRAPFQRKEEKPMMDKRKVMQTMTGANSASKIPVKSPTSQATATGTQAPKPRGAQAPRPQAGQAPRPQTGQAPRPQTGQTSRPPMNQKPRQQTANRIQNEQPLGWKSKNFMADDDEFEFEFLPIDTPDQK